MKSVYLLIDPKGIPSSPVYTKRAIADAELVRRNLNLRSRKILKGEYWRVRKINVEV